MTPSIMYLSHTGPWTVTLSRREMGAWPMHALGAPIGMPSRRASAREPFQSFEVSFATLPQILSCLVSLLERSLFPITVRQIRHTDDNKFHHRPVWPDSTRSKVPALEALLRFSLPPQLIADALLFPKPSLSYTLQACAKLFDLT